MQWGIESNYGKVQLLPKSQRHGEMQGRIFEDDHVVCAQRRVVAVLAPNIPQGLELNLKCNEAGKSVLTWERLDPFMIRPAFLAVVLAGFAQGQEVPQTTRGFELGDPSLGINLILPLSIAQCDHFIVFYNITPTIDGLNANVSYPLDASITFTNADADNGYKLFELSPPNGTGYIDWVCNFPVGHSFIAWRFGGLLYTVQDGSSDCTDAVTTTSFSYASYPNTAQFASYTAHDSFYSPFGFLSAYVHSPTLSQSPYSFDRQNGHGRLPNRLLFNDLRSHWHFRVYLTVFWFYY